MIPGGPICAVFLALLHPAGASSPEDPLRDAGAAFAQGRLKEAEALYAKSMERSCSPSVVISLAAVKTRLGKTDESSLLLEKALAADWRNSQAWLLLGMNSLERNRNEEALADLMQAVIRDDSNPRAHNYLGIAAGRSGLADLSERELRRAAELDPAYADAHFNLAVFYMNRTPPLVEMSRRHYQRALDLGSKRDQAVEARIANAFANPTAATPSPPASLNGASDLKK